MTVRAQSENGGVDFWGMKMCMVHGISRRNKCNSKLWASSTSDELHYGRGADICNGRHHWRRYRQVRRLGQVRQEHRSSRPPCAPGQSHPPHRPTAHNRRRPWHPHLYPVLHENCRAPQAGGHCANTAELGTRSGDSPPPLAVLEDVLLVLQCTLCCSY